MFMTTSDLYIHGTGEQLGTISKMMMGLAEQLGIATDNESNMNIPLGQLMRLLIGDSFHLGLVVGMNTEDPCCVVLRIESQDIVPVYEALLECFNGIEVEVDEDTGDVPWPFV